MTEVPCANYIGKRGSLACRPALVVPPYTGLAHRQGDFGPAPRLPQRCSNPASKRLRTFCTRGAGFGPGARVRRRVCVPAGSIPAGRASVYVRFAPAARVLDQGRGSGAGFAFMQEASRPGEEQASTYVLHPPRGFRPSSKGTGPGWRLHEGSGIPASKRLRTFCTRGAGFGPGARVRRRVCVPAGSIPAGRASVYVRFAPAARVLDQQ